jgi:hypothetical protein
MNRASPGSPARRDLGEVDRNVKREGVRACVCVCVKTVTAVVVSKFCNVYAASIPHLFCCISPSQKPLGGRHFIFT